MRMGCIQKLLLTTGLYLFFSSIPTLSISQYILNGSASQNTCNCYTLTQTQQMQSGSVWNSKKIDLNNAFDFKFNVYLGCQDSSGADGIVFILQPVSTSLGSLGEGIGFSGIAPSIGISLDTWQNFNQNDPAYDHISIQANGIVRHGSDLAGPIPASATSDNIEDCAWHIFRISWDPSTKWLRTYFDGVLRLEVQYDLITNIFNNDPLVYWGFSAATGGSYNLQQFCTALNPQFTTDPSSGTACFNGQFTFQDQSVSFAPIQSWYWDFGDGSTSTLQNPPVHSYNAPGIYPVKQLIKALDGCTSDTLTKNIAIGSKPIAGFHVFDTCSGVPPRVTDLSTNAVGNVNQWTWILDGLVVSNNQQPLFTNLVSGSHPVKLVVKSVYDCESDTASGSFIINPPPAVDMIAADGCLDQPINFTGLLLDNSPPVTQWNWNFGDGTISHQQNPVHTYLASGNMSVSLSGQYNGCVSASVTKSIKINYVDVTAMSDTIALLNTPFKVGNSFTSNTSSIPSFMWSPPRGLDNTTALMPTATLQDDITYVVTASIAEGCTDKDTVNIIVFKGSAIYVPTGFSPNGDGLNDKLRPSFVGIKSLRYFRIYNRWGHLVFSTGNLKEGWDGKISGIVQQTGTYVWMLEAEDVIGKVYKLKGVSTIVR